jgi:hypothetical protein
MNGKQLDWRTSRRRTIRTHRNGFNLIIWPQRGGGWRVRVQHSRSKARRYSGLYVTIEEAKAAALDLVAQMEARGA